MGLQSFLIGWVLGGEFAATGSLSRCPQCPGPGYSWSCILALETGNNIQLSHVGRKWAGIQFLGASPLLPGVGGSGNERQEWVNQELRSELRCSHDGKWAS